MVGKAAAPRPIGGDRETAKRPNERLRAACPLDLNCFSKRDHESPGSRPVPSNTRIFSLSSRFEREHENIAAIGIALKAFRDQRDETMDALAKIHRCRRNGRACLRAKRRLGTAPMRRRPISRATRVPRTSPQLLDDRPATQFASRKRHGRRGYHERLGILSKCKACLQCS